MASNQTSNFGLNQWAAEDAVLREDFNADNAKIDAALAKCGNCRIEMGTYVGKGTCDSANKNSIAFSAKPLLVIITGPYTALFPGTASSGYATCAYPTGGGCNNFSWSGNTLYWFNPNTADLQLNKSGQTYTYLAVYADT